MYTVGGYVEAGCGERRVGGRLIGQTSRTVGCDMIEGRVVG